MSKILANQIANYGDDAPIEIKEGLNIPAGKPIQAAGSAGSAGQVLSTTGTTVQWISPFDGDYNSLTNTPSIPAAQVNSDWNASSGAARILNKPVVPPQPSVTTNAAGTAALSYNSTNGQFTYTPPDLTGYATTAAVANSGNWDTAYGWGDHAAAGYLGSQADNVVIGDATTGDAITTGDQNVVIGQGAGSAITTKTNNVFVGPRAGAEDIGSYNVAIGPDAGDTSFGEFQNVENTAVGRLAGDIRNGNGNTALGFAALSSSYTSGFSFGNIALGYYAMGNYKIDGARYNTSIGQQTGWSLTSGDANVFIGDYAGYDITTGSNNVLLGTSAGADITTGDNNVIINGGNYQNGTTSGFTATTSNSLWIGHSSYAWITGTSSGNTRSVDIPGQLTVGSLTAGSLTAGGLTYPTINGTSGQVLTSDGAGNVLWSAAAGGGSGIALTDLSVTTNAAGSAALTYNNVSGVFTYTPPDLSGYLTSFTETDPVFSVSPAASISTAQINNWNSAYSWGDHSAAGYLTSYTETDTLDTVLGRGATTTRDITTTGKVYFSNNFATTGDLPNATTYHGMFAHVHAEAHGYFAHGGAWTQLLDTGSALGDLADVSAAAPATNDVLTWNGTGWAPAAAQGGGGGGAANVTISDTLPSGTPASGDLWWESDTGRLKIYYQDTDTAQWVDASPPLADATSIGGQGTVSMKASIIPDTNDTYDLGNAEYKIRDLYLGNNSIFIGDDFILGVNDTEDGNEQPEFRKRKRSENHVPKPILTAAIANGIGADKAAVVTHALAWFNAQLDPDAANLADKRITLRFWYAYGVAVLPASWREDYPSPKSLLPPPGDSEFDENEYEQITKIGQEGARKAPVIDGGAVVNVNLKLGFPHYVIKNPTGDITMNVSGAKWEEGAAFSATVYISQGAIARPLTGLKVRNPEGVLVNAGQLRPSGRPPEANEVSVYEIRAVFLDGAWKASKQGA